MLTFSDYCKVLDNVTVKLCREYGFDTIHGAGEDAVPVERFAVDDYKQALPPGEDATCWLRNHATPHRRFRYILRENRSEAQIAKLLFYTDYGTAEIRINEIGELYGECTHSDGAKMLAKIFRYTESALKKY